MAGGTLKILLDTCVWGGVYQKLLELGYDVVWTGLWQRDPGDAEILNYAYREQRVLFTLDKDFGELAMLHHTLWDSTVSQFIGTPTTQVLSNHFKYLPDGTGGWQSYYGRTWQNQNPFRYSMAK